MTYHSTWRENSQSSNCRAGIHRGYFQVAMASKESKKGGWKRPEDTGPYPCEWDRFEGLKPMPDGRVPTYWIRDLTPDMADAALEHMVRHYIRQETMAACMGIADDPQSMAEWDALWRSSIRQRVSLAAFTDWPDGSERLVGVNLLAVAEVDDPPYKAEGKSNRPGFQFYNEMMTAADVFKRYGVSCYLAGLGLSVHTDFRGQGVALQLLRARQPMCAALRIPLTVTAFSGPQSQKQAQRAGFEVINSRRYADFVFENGERPLKDASWTHMEIQAKYYGLPDDQQK